MPSFRFTTRRAADDDPDDDSGADTPIAASRQLLKPGTPRDLSAYVPPNPYVLGLKARRRAAEASPAARGVIVRDANNVPNGYLTALRNRELVGR
jgi:hypothetical protein